MGKAKRVELVTAGPALGRRPLLDRVLIRKIADAVGRGSFLHVAAESVGVSRRTLFGWLERGRDLAGRVEAGETLDEREVLHVELLHAVTMAHAGARVKAEAAVFEQKPLEWLRYGPGRDHGPENPGWTLAVREVPAEVKSAAEQLLAEALAQLGLGHETVTPALGVGPWGDGAAEDVGVADVRAAQRAHGGAVCKTGSAESDDTGRPEGMSAQPIFAPRSGGPVVREGARG